MSYRAEAIFHGLPPLQSHRRRAHWAQVHREDRVWKQAVHWRFATRAPSAPLSHAGVTCIRVSMQEPDYDNLVHSFKPLLDGLVAARVLEDDKPRNFVGGHPDYHWRKAPRRAMQHVVVRVEEDAA